ncbi:ABC transporter substrate-binding protein [Gandjariella thermophila]|uniref:Putative nitrate ABC transporter, periplasmic protein n=1 Tax=Gandjariella thermophila TaxID=1931992 RepID=A0A4D4IXG7_9PSEU|nr:ABC transporter substrate-binding protein [Gandjariella thermophila]GDY29065.1 putative nitrate ABC transporter, periplasmic protein [Gandjariella thermophila]
MEHRKAWIVAVVSALVAALGGCGGGASAGETVPVVVGYQSRTINTVTAGTLLRSLGYFEKRLAELGARTGKKYTVTWRDYDTGAPITAQMIAGKIDIGSMGDYPMLINGSRTQKLSDNRTEMVSVTGYNARGALNMVVVAPNSTATSLVDLKGQKVSTSVGSAAHGTLVHALSDAGLNPVTDVRTENQQPSVGASALQAGGVAALSQFVAWPGQLVFAGQAKPLYDGGALNVPTLHGVVVRRGFAAEQPDVLDAFLSAQLDATRHLWAHPLAAAESVARDTGLPPEVVYLYNGRNGMVTFDATVKSEQRAALRGDLPFLKSIGNLDDLDVGSFVDDGALRRVYGGSYDADTRRTDNQARIGGADPVCQRPVTDPATAGETWLAGEEDTHPSATPTCLLRFVKSAQAGGKRMRAAYVPDALTGTRWFADHAVRVTDPAAGPDTHLLPFTTEANARRYLAAHPGATELDYPTALAQA